MIVTDPQVSSNMTATKTVYFSDSQNSKRHGVPVDQNTIRASDLANVHFRGGQSPKGLRIVDQGLKHIAIGSSQITFLDAEHGRLYYRGYEINSILGNKTYEETCYCLIWGEFPTSAEAGLFQKSLAASIGQLPRLIHDVIQKYP